VSVKVFINGELFDEGEARVPVFDRGFLYGDSVYEVFRTAGGKPVDMEPHLDRLERSATALVLPLPPRADIEAAVAATMEAAANSESYVRVIVTRGKGAIGLDPALAVEPLLIVIARPLQSPSAEQYAAGIKLQIVGVERTSRRAVDPAVKSGNYLNSVMALAEARQHEAYEAIMLDRDGRVAEGSTSNVFVVKDGRLRTPNLEVGILGGITRWRVLRIAGELGVETEEGEVWPDDLRGADEVFITSSIRGVLPVREVGSAEGVHRPGAGAPGPATRRIMDRYEAFLGEVATG